MQDECIFCKIVAGDMPANIVAETDKVLVIKDITPKTTIHYLILPKAHYKDLQAATECNVACSLMSMARKLSQENPDAAEYRLVINNGYKAGQRVFHLHMHFLAGSKIPEF